MSKNWGTGDRKTAGVGYATDFKERTFKYDPTTIRRMPTVKSNVFPFGLPTGSIISVIGAPKTGKTQYCLHECMLAAREGADCLYLINESPKQRFLEIVDRHAKTLKLGKVQLEKLTFVDMYGEELGSANYQTIDSYFSGVWASVIKYWLSKAENPRFIVIDSFSKTSRVYVPQMFKAIEVFTRELVKMRTELNKHPVFIFVHQKSGAARDSFDKSVVGGQGLIHETDGTILFMQRKIDSFMVHRNHDLTVGKRFWTVEFDMRDCDALDEEMLIIKDTKTGRLRLGQTYAQYVEPELDVDDTPHTERNDVKGEFKDEW